jgi:hypothetical protein
MNTVISALDTLALALVDHDHVWTDRERQLYERAIGFAIFSSDDYMEIDSSASEKRPTQTPSHR